MQGRAKRLSWQMSICFLVQQVTIFGLKYLSSIKMLKLCSSIAAANAADSITYISEEQITKALFNACNGLIAPSERYMLEGRQNWKWKYFGLLMLPHESSSSCRSRWQEARDALSDVSARHNLAFNSTPLMDAPPPPIAGLPQLRSLPQSMLEKLRPPASCICTFLTGRNAALQG